MRTRLLLCTLAALLLLPLTVLAAPDLTPEDTVVTDPPLDVPIAPPEGADSQPESFQEGAEVTTPPLDTSLVTEEETVGPDVPPPVLLEAPFPDLKGHWAEGILRRACEDGILHGFQDGTLRPDAPVNRAEALSILTRLLGARYATDYAALGFDGSEWYAEATAKGAYLGLTEGGAPLDVLTRAEGASLLGMAFALRGSVEPADLSGYQDAAFCTRAEQQALGTLLQFGYLQGHNGLLVPSEALTRAEFCTILYRILDSGRLEGGEAGLYGAYEGPVFLDCSASALTLTDVRAPSLTLLSQELTEIDLRGENRIDRLTLAGGNGEGFVFSTNSAGFVDTLVIGQHRGPVTVDSPVKTLRIAGDGQTVTLNAPVERLILLGKGTVLTVNSAVPVAELYGEEIRLRGSGRIATAIHVSGSLGMDREDFIADWQDERDPGITGLILSASAPERLPEGSPLTYTVTLQNPRERTVTLLWAMDGVQYHRERAVIGPQGRTVSYTYPITYERNMSLNRALSFTLRYEDAGGVVTTMAHSAAVTLERDDGITYAASVVSGYQGDYTRAWAESHDYTPETKTAWINGRGTSSKTGYLLWINLSHQRVNVFTGSQGNWVLADSFLCATGRPARSTPQGTYTVTARKESGWTTRSYHVSPVVNFTNATYKEMAFHSRKYEGPKKARLIDASIGFPVSDGCVRMFDEDVRWIFDTIPNGTTVIVY